MYIDGNIQYSNLRKKVKIVDKLAINDISFKYSIYKKNTVRNIMTLYTESATEELKHIIKNNSYISAKK